jgi:nucleoside-diphosphate-sugar epimerase
MVEILATGYGDDKAPKVPNVTEVSLLMEDGKDAPETMPGNVRVTYGDISTGRGVAKALEGCDVVFHLAAIIHPSWRGIDRLYAVNVDGTRNIVEAAIAAGVKRIVYVSSNSVAGVSTSLGRPFRESDPSRPYLSYGESKAQSERLILDAAAAGKLEGVILRGCWYYGRWQADRQTRFFRMVAAGNPVMFGNGRNMRSLTYVDHLISAIFASATVKEANRRIYWIADERPYETIEIYNAIADALGVRRPRPRKLPGLVSKACAIADVVLQKAGIYWKEVHVAGEMAEDIACSIDRARKELGFEPWVELPEGMERSVAWCYERGHDLSPAHPPE